MIMNSYRSAHVRVRVISAARVRRSLLLDPVYVQDAGRAKLERLCKAYLGAASNCHFSGFFCFLRGEYFGGIAVPTS